MIDYTRKVYSSKLFFKKDLSISKRPLQESGLFLTNIFFSSATAVPVKSAFEALSLLYT
jgi:hypothetical protein